MRTEAEEAFDQLFSLVISGIEEIDQETKSLARLGLSRHIPLIREVISELKEESQMKLFFALAEIIREYGRAHFNSKFSYAKLRDELEKIKLARQHSDRQATAGIKSGEVRRNNRPWTAHARELVKAIIAQSPEFGRDRIATQITVLWKLEEDLLPGHETLKKYVEELEAKGDIPTHAERKRRGNEPVQPG
jgi:hypothetical protein